MFLARYGSNVTVQDTFTSRVAGLRNYNNPILVFFDEQGAPQEIPVSKDVVAQVTFPTPYAFGPSIQLVGYELVGTRLKPGEPLVIILYWQATHKVDRDYTVFVHLLDSGGSALVGKDSQPRNGTSPTSGWLPNELNPDAVMFFVPPDAPIGHNYRLEIGLYDLPTSQRLAMADGGDHLVIESIEVGP
jgi:hypothetical protein